VGNAATIRYSPFSKGYVCGNVASAHSGVSNFAILHGNIEVNADEDTLALKVEICDREFVRERHGRR
jgi:hypothetical protein